MKKLTHPANAAIVSVKLLMIVMAVYITACSKSAADESNPAITNISPLKAGNHTTITITGSGFNILADSSGCIKVYFQSSEACGYLKDNNTLEVEVPFDAGDGPVCIIYKGARICGNQSFDYQPGNPAANTYMRLADCPNTPTNQLQVLVATNNAILAGFNNWWKYDIDKNTWSVMQAPVDKVTRAATFTFNGKAYVFGGVGAGFSNRLQCYDPATGGWSFKAPMPSTPRGDGVAFVWNNKVYIAGGADTYVLGMNTVYNQLWQYDPVADSWLRKADMPEGAGEGCYALRIGQKFYIPSAGGYGVQEYNPETNTWTQFPATQNFPTYAIPYSDNSFSLGYIIGGRAGFTEIGWITRVSLNPANQLLGEIYKQPPSPGYTTISGAFYAVVNNEVYYGMGYFDANGVLVQGNQFWRYRY